MSDTTQCRICLCEISLKNIDETPSIAKPCYCRGSMEYVHQACLKRWVLHSGRLFCQVCLFKYKLAKETTPLNQILKNLRTTAESQKCLFRLKLRALEYGGWLTLFVLYYLVINNFYGFDITAAISLPTNVTSQWTYFNLSVQSE